MDRQRQGQELSWLFYSIPKVTIAAVNGHAMGAGLGMAMSCDLRLASENAKFGWYFIRRAVMGTVGGTYILRQIVGLSKAFELTLTGDLIDAAEAERIGLVSKVVPEDQLMEEATAALSEFKISLDGDNQPIGDEER